MNTQLLKYQVTAITFLLASCTTGKKDGSHSDVAASNMPNDTIVVQQAGSETPAVSSYNRSYFMDARKTLSSAEARLYATLGTGAMEAAEQDARAYLAKNPNNAAALTVLASALVLQRKFPLAAFYASQLEKVGPDNPDVYNIRGLAELFNSRNSVADFRRATDLFQKAFHASGNQIASGLNLAHLQLEMGNAQAAADTFRQVSSRNPTCKQAWLGYGIAKSRTGDYKEASAAIQTVLDKDKNHPEALYYLALIQKNGYNDQKSSGKTLRTIIANSSTPRAVRQKAQSLLRLMESEGDRTEVAKEQKEDNDLIMTNMSAPKRGKDDEE